MKYYHLTSKENLDSILKEGLKCHIGENSKAVNEDEEYIYLCKYEDIPYWKILLNKDTILEIDIPELYARMYEYSHYNEFLYDKNIDSKYIKLYNEPIKTNKAMRKLCMSYIHTINKICLVAARLYTRNCNDYNERDIPYVEDELSQVLDSTLLVLDRLDYSVLHTSERRLMLINLGEDGEYTFCDNYLNTEYRLWEKLIRYKSDRFHDRFKLLYHYIRRTFYDVLDLSTGGWG